MPTAEQVATALSRSASREQLLEMRRTIATILEELDKIEATHKINPVFKMEEGARAE